MKLTFYDRINFSITALKKHTGLLVLGLLFLSIGSFLIYLGITLNDAKLLIYIGGFVILFILFFFGFTMPSSLLYYYEKSVIKKYGSYTNAIVTEKHIEDHSYTENINNRVKPIKEFHYIINYQFMYQRKYTNSFYVNSKDCFDKIEVGLEIPIKFLKIKPEQAKPRRQKLCKDLGLEIKACS